MDILIDLRKRHELTLKQLKDELNKISNLSLTMMVIKLIVRFMVKQHFIMVLKQITSQLVQS